MQTYHEIFLHLLLRVIWPEFFGTILVIFLFIVAINKFKFKLFNVIMLVFSIFLLLNSIKLLTIPMVLQSYDYITNNYQEFEGIVYQVTNDNSYYYFYFYNDKVEYKVLRSNATIQQGEKIKVIYGNSSKLVLIVEPEN